MVVAEGPNEYILYMQNDHGDLAGQFAAHWGNDRFSQLKPRNSMVFAAEAHDNGWWSWDVNPEVDDQGVPITFRRTPRARLYEFIDKGIDNIIEKDLYAGLITSIHHAGLPQHRYGTLPAVPRRQDEYTTKFLQRREPFKTDLIAKVATMVGLFLTVVSMINTFTAISDTSKGGNVASVTNHSAAIGLALFGTAGGLMIAIPLVFTHVMFKARVAKFEVQMKAAAQRLLLLFQTLKPKQGDLKGGAR